MSKNPVAATGPLKDVRYPLRAVGGYDPLTLLAVVDRLLVSPDVVLRAPSVDLQRHASHKQIIGWLKSKYGAGPSTFDMVMDGWNAPKPDHPFDLSTRFGNIFKTAGHIGKQTAHTFKIEKTAELMRAFDVCRPVLSLTEKEKLILRGLASLVADGFYSHGDWTAFLARLAWNGGNTRLEATSTHARIEEVRAVLFEFLRQHLGDHEVFLAEAGATAARAAKLPQHTDGPVADVFSTGARWMTFSDLASSKIYSMHRSPSSLLLGTMPTPGGDHEVLFDGHESLITFGGPGAGKSQAHVATNLLRFPGSAIVLDIKGELWKSTAGYREKHFGKVYRFAPTDPFGNTHRYNPLAFIRDDPNGAAEDCTIFSYQVVVDNPKLHDPYWESRGRDFIWAFAMMVALRLKGEQRTVESLYEAISLPTSDDPASAIHQMAAAMVGDGRQHGIPDLVSAGNSLKSGLASSDGAKRIESVLDSARRHLSGFARSAHTRAALSGTDWTPDAFRNAPGSTLYICLTSDELEAYAGIVRVILDQHARAFTRDQVTRTDTPITLFIDEMPQLNNFKFITRLQDIGRGSGIRLWMFCQSIGQLADRFGEGSAMNLIGNCRTQCFMQPDAKAAEYVGVPLGDIRDLFSGERRPLAAPSDLMGRRYGDKVIVTTRADIPMVLDKVWAFEAYRDRTTLPPPVVAGSKKS